jgi:predicted O-linked N-acetylglucosamine transferase (SPINDLY family)
MTTNDTTATKPFDVTQTLNQAIRLHRAGQLPDAERLYRLILTSVPDHPDAHHNLGLLAMRRNQADIGLAHLKAALESKPGFDQFWLSYIAALLRAGRPESARQVLAQGRQFGLAGDAVESLARQLAPDKAAAPVATEQSPSAHRSASRKKPADITKKQHPSPQEISTLSTLYRQGQYAAAETLARKLTTRFPRHGFGWKALGAVLKSQGRTTESLEPKQKAALLSPHDAETHNNLGFTLFELGRLEEAEASCRRAIEIQPDLASAHNNLGNVCNDLGRIEEAEACYRRALELAPDFVLAHGNLGNTLKDLGRLDEAVDCYRRAMAGSPDSFHYAMPMHLLLPIIAKSVDDAALWLQRYSDGIETLKRMPGLLSDPLVCNYNPLSFYLAYHNHNDKQIMTALGQLFRSKYPALSVTAPHIRQWSPPQASARIRLGFISKFLVGHTIGKLYQGYIAHLDRSKFEVVVIHLSRTKLDEVSSKLTELADKTITLTDGLAAQQAAIAAEKLDVLFYPDIGMAPASYFLAFARLAPVQVVSWGHPDTTGLETIDYFISAASIEAADANDHYTERLIRLGRLPCHYQPLLAPTQILPRSSFSLPENGTLYGCPQALFKFHPDFDAVLAAIATGDPEGHIVLLEGKHQTWTEMLRRRWAASHPVLLERVIFLPRMSLRRFMMFMANLDVILDPIHFGSGNTLYEGMVYGKPIVTWPGRFMRGRIVAGAYRQMGIANAPIVANLEEYVSLALALGRDPERRAALRQASLAAAERELFADLGAVRELEAFLEAAVDAAGRGERLPADWSESYKPELTRKTQKEQNADKI